ncbi:MAG: DNA primase [Prevotellaceae bacterium]|jgi:DNA primase catalytic core|nr:DNA primase [Prevotellaceae bacterium]
MIQQETIDKILSKINIADIVGDYVKLRKQGANYVGCCPFHDEKTASFVVSPAKGIFKCFGCGCAGNVIKFIQEQEQVSFPEAVKLLAVRASIVIEDDYKPSAEEQAKYARRESLKVVTRFAEIFFWENHDKPYHTYLLQRKFKPSTIQMFRLGYASDDWHKLSESAQKAGFKSDILADASLMGEGDKGTYDYFRNRIIFPICDIIGNVVGFTGRSISGNEQVKYLNSRDSELFSKGKCLYGIHLAKKSIIKEDECILLEGNFDVMRFHELGFTNSVAACGTALTKEQIALIRRFTSNVLMCYDGDSAGTKATFRNAELLLSEGMNVRIVSLPSGHDPDSFGLSVGADLVKKLLSEKKDFVSFKYEVMKQAGQNDPIQLAAAVKELERTIALIPESVTREMYINNVAKMFDINKKSIIDAVKKSAVKPIEQKDDGWIGLELAKESIVSKNKCYIVDTMEMLVTYHANGKENTILSSGNILYANVQELNGLTQRIEFVNNDTDFLDNLGANTQISNICIWMLDFKFDIIVQKKSSFDEENTVPENFLSAYSSYCSFIISENSGDAIIHKRLIDQCCNILAKLDETTLTVCFNKFCDGLNLTSAALNKILKPHISAKKTKSVLKREASNVGGKRYDFDINNLPEYVDKEFFYRHGYFPAQDEKGRKIFYVFRTQEGGLQMVGNFYIEPLFHVFDTEAARNKRIVRINNAESGMTFYTEFVSEKLVDFGQFKKVLFNEGGNVFTRGKASHHEAILASIANQFPKCWEINEFGQQDEDFYAFANAIYSDGEIKYTDELGLVQHGNKTYYSPAFSKIYSDLRSSNDKYGNDRWFIFRENNDTDFATWVQLMVEVYKQNDNGYWAVLYALLSAFRSDIFSINRLFTAPFFIGPTESGKTQIAVSIRSIFMHPDAPLFNLNSGTDAAFFSSLERYRDVAMVFEEYNDYQISDIKFQGLKAAVYDGEGKQKKKDATSKDLDISKINCAVILLGQEAPERDDGSLANRCILLHVPKKDDWTEHEREIFDNLKARQKNGLSGVLLQILKQRETVKAHFADTLNNVYKELKQDLSANGDIHQTRLLNTVSLFLSICKLWEQYVPQLRLPFTYKHFYNIARAKVISQSETISSTNRLSVFFETLEVLLNKQHDGLIYGRDFKIEWQNKLVLQIDRKTTVEQILAKETRVLFLRIGLIHPLYQKIRGSETLKVQNLLMYLKDHPAYIGNVKSTRFSWKEYVEDKGAMEYYVRKTERINQQNTSAIALDYLLLKELTNINLDKDDDTEETIFPPVTPQ